MLVVMSYPMWLAKEKEKKNKSMNAALMCPPYITQFMWEVPLTKKEIATTQCYVSTYYHC